MTLKEILGGIEASLRQRNIFVKWVDDGADDIEVGELRSGMVSLNRQARSELDMIFTIAHLFGHYCQFLNFPKYQHLVEAVAGPFPIDPPPGLRESFQEYELEAFGIGKTLMSQVFTIDAEMERKYYIFMVTDFDHFWDHISKGVREDVRSFNTKLAQNYEFWPECITPIALVPIPEPVTPDVAAGASVVIF